MHSLDADPIAAALAPPMDESPEQRHNRILTERAAKKVSDEIDEQLSRERQQAKRQPKPVKILLLGKSTTLKNFQLMCEPKAFRTERASWRAIIQLNVIRSIRIILDALALPSSAAESPSPHLGSSSRDSHRLDADLLALRMRLLPLLEVEEILTRRLATLEDAPSTPRPQTLSTIFRRRPGNEVAVNSTVPWKSAFMRDTYGRESFATEDAVDWEDPEDPGIVLYERAEDMRHLWEHPTVRAVLERQRIRLQESPGFFLDELDVVTSQRYVPTDDHILRARLKTLGVAEHRLQLTDPSNDITREFRIFDVGGQRSNWVPYFDDMNCVICLVPISTFDEVLEEEPEVNRLADSVDLWTQIVKNKLLQETNLILFLNKTDILQAKLASGIRFADYVVSYGRRPNDFDSTSRYMRRRFGTILKESSPVPRSFYYHLTNAIDAKATKYVLAGIKDMLIQAHLKGSGLIV
ncbi:guanine nucleotide binding protein, alpha subunit [Mycena leptocephala]|nr:guanine nucleotide binding protein, alpha subunit [Mycena leptocephala]